VRASQLRTGISPVRVLEQQAVVEADRLNVRRHQAALAPELAALPCRPALVGKLDPRPLGEPLDRLHEGEVGVLGEEVDAVTALAAAEADPDPALRIDRE
jgi:hypothetical protein